VAYMATELELFVNSPFLRLLQNTAPHLVRDYDAAFARYGYSYADAFVGEVASYCRVWTEGAFPVVYRMRLAGRAARNAENPYRKIVDRYKIATYGLLLSLTCALCERIRPGLLDLWQTYCGDLPLHTDRPVTTADFVGLWEWVVDGQDTAELGRVEFHREYMERRRDA
jgi:hypothetical protein